MFDRIDPNEAQRRVQAGAALIDVREIAEYEQARIPGAVLIPLSEFAQRYTELPQHEVVLMCAAGVRSAQAAQFAAQHGYRVTNLEGGINAWNAAGLPIELGGTYE
jgi:rhodanese-related sulfurtransferase